MNDLVSIIMPNYNSSKYLPETIKSVIAQSYSAWELIIVDDCSTDESVSIIKKYCSIDRRIKFFINERNSGAAFSRNYALSQASGRWIAFLDSDDIWFSEKLAKQIKFMELNNFHFTYTNYNRIDENSNNLMKVISGPKVITRRTMFRYNYIGCLTAIYDRNVVGIIHVDERLKSKNDYAMWLQVCQKCNCYLLNDVLGSYRVRSNSISHISLKASIKNQYILFRIGLHMGVFRSCWHTFINIIFGLAKKISYERNRR